MTRRFWRMLAACLIVLGWTATAHSRRDPQGTLNPAVNSGGKELKFDWPMLQIGTGEYKEGPTGVTVFRFGRKVLGAVDVRGGGPGTVNTDYLRLGYETPDLDAVVYSGGSWYGLESVTAVASALKDDGVRTGAWDSVALSVGAIVYDFGDRRLNEIYPDKRLAQAAFRAAQPGTFRQGAAGAGRFTRTGDFFGCKAHSGQGGAFRQIGNLKIAAFTVVNALGVVTTRDGRVAACYPNANWPKDLRTEDLFSGLPESRKSSWVGATGGTGPKRNTTISLIVVNQKMGFAELQRLATQVHTSMARALQPFATMADGDVLYAVSTGELDPPAGKAALSNPDIGALASELMWDAVLSSVPDQPAAPMSSTLNTPPTVTVLRRLLGDYRFSSFVSVRVTLRGETLFAQAVGERNAYAIGRGEPVALVPVSNGLFTVPGRYPLTLSFASPGRLIINPGSWEQHGVRK